MVSHWRHVLQLDDWSVSVVAVRLADLPQGAAAASETDSKMRALRIYVLTPSDYPALAKREGIAEKRGKEITKDIEDSVIHEMVHLRLRDYRMATSDDLPLAEEVVVVRITNALLHK